MNFYRVKIEAFLSYSLFNATKNTDCNFKCKLTIITLRLISGLITILTNSPLCLQGDFMTLYLGNLPLRFVDNLP